MRSPQNGGSGTPSARDTDGERRGTLVVSTGAAVVGGAVYFVGGFSYSAPYTYNDTLKLSRAADGSWGWTELPNFPYPVDSYTGVVAVGTKLYLMGGAVYTAAKGAAGFYVNETGGRLYSLDTEDLAKGWAQLSSIPGSSRWVQSVSSVGTDIVVIGGATGSNPSHAITTIVDNWKFSTETKTWAPLINLPIADSNFNGNGNQIYQGRYIILAGGYQYDDVVFPNGTTMPSWGTPMQMCTFDALRVKKSKHCRLGCAADVSKVKSNEYYNDIFVYDVQADEFGRATASSTAEPCLLPPNCGPLPMNNNVPQLNVNGNDIFVVGGEVDPRTICGDDYGHYPTLALHGKITEL